MVDVQQRRGKSGVLVARSAGRREALAWSALFVVHILVASFLLRSGVKPPFATSGGALGSYAQSWTGGHPPSEHHGTCWCRNGGKRNACPCTPSLAVDVILTSGLDHVWMVMRKDTGQLACMGGFVEVGETAESAVLRELKEETGLELSDAKPVFQGLYSDPRRDNRRHTASVAYILDVPIGSEPKGADDAKDVVRVPIEEIDNSEYDVFADHMTILLDYRDGRRASTSSIRQETRASRSRMCS